MSAVYSDYANSTRSSKIVLCHVEPKQRLAVFTLDSGTIYKKTVSYFIINVSEDNVDLVAGSSTAIATGEWYYDATNGELYVNTTDDSDPKTKKIIVTYRFFFSNRSIDLPYDLASGSEVHYHGRLNSNSPIKKELDDEQIGVVLETSTNITFENTDAYFDDFYDTLIWENKDVRLWSWNEKIPLSVKVKLFDGLIQDKSFSNRSVRFSCKDFTYKLRKPVVHTLFSVSDGDVPERYLYKPKRRIFGKVKQLQCTPIDATLSGYNLTGTVSGSGDSVTLTGSGTSFLAELSPEDTIIYTIGFDTYKMSVLTVDSDTVVQLSDVLPIRLTNASVIVSPIRPYRNKNRNWSIAGHKLRAPSTTVAVGSQPNRFTLTDVSDILVGDLLQIDGQNGYVKRISGTNIVLEANLGNGTPANGTVVVKNPVSTAFINGVEIIIDRDWTVTNTATDAKLILDPLAEFNVAQAVNIAGSLVFTNGSRTIGTGGLDLRTELQVRDWIRSDDITHTTYYEVLSVSETEIKVRTNYTGNNITTNAQKKNVILLEDSAIVTVNCMGQERSGVWVKTASDAVKDLLENDISFTNIDTSSFTESDADAPFILSYALPEAVGGGIRQVKTVISDINASVFGSLVIDNSFNLKYQILTPEKPTDLVLIKDDDLTSEPTVKSKNEIVRKVSVRYSHFVDNFTGDSAFELYEFTNEFVDDLIGADAELDKDIYLFNLDDATTIAQRYALYNSLSQSNVTIKGKLNLALKLLNDKIYIELDRLYKRFGSNNRRKIGIVNKVINDGKDVTIEINDLGNVFNRVANISTDASPDFTSATEDDKMKYSYIVDDDTLTPDATSDVEIHQNIVG